MILNHILYGIKNVFVPHSYNCLERSCLGKLLLSSLQSKELPSNKSISLIL